MSDFISKNNVESVDEEWTSSEDFPESFKGFSKLSSSCDSSALLENNNVVENSVENTVESNLHVPFELLDEKYKNVIVLKSIEKAEEFMKTIGVQSMIVYGGALYKNNLKPDLSIDDYDVALSGPERNKDKVKEIVKNLKDQGWDVYNGKLDYLNENLYYYIVAPNRIKYDFGYKKKVITTLTLENLVIELEKDKNGNIKRYIEDTKVIDDLYNGKLCVNEARIPNKFELVQRIILTSIKYSDKVKLSNNQAIIEKAKKRANEEDEIGEDGTNITNIKKGVCLEKIYGLLAKMKDEDKEPYIKELLDTELLDLYLPDLAKVLKDDKNRQKIFKFTNGNILRQYTECLMKDNTAEKALQ